MFRFSEKSGVHGFSGLHGTSGVYGNSGVYKVSGFNPLDLDPYLLFDAQKSMIGTLENPTLDLDPSKQDTLDVITATRAGVATFTDVNGNIATAPANTVRVDQTQGAEVTPTVFQHIGHTDFSTDWTKSNVAVSTSEFNAPDGTSTAYKITNSSSSGNHFIRDSITGGANPSTVVSGRSYTLSVFLRKGTKDVVSIGDGFNVNVLARFNLTSGTVTNFSASNSSIEQVGDWFRCSATITPTGTTLGLMLFTGNNYAGHDTSGDFHAFGPQLEEGTTPTTFVANTTGSAKFITGATFGPRVPMILVEPSATNLLPYSEDFSNAAWVKNDTSITSSAATSPDGANNASLLTVNSSSVSYLREFFTISATAHTFSIYAKAGTATDIQLYVVEQGITSGTADVNIETGEVTNVTSNWNGGVTTEDVGDGWFRIKGTRNFTTSAPNHGIGIAATGQNGLNCYIWGAQVETGSVATSYIPTSGSTVTRAADDLAITGSAFSSFYNQSEGTLYVEYEPRFTNVTNSALFFFSDGGSANRIMSLVHQSYNLFIATSDVTVAQFGGGIPQANTLNRVAATFKANDARLSLNGANEVTDTSLTTPSVNQLHIGQRTSLVHQLNGHIKRLIYWPYHSDSL